MRPVKAMCPERVCRVCGKPSERITGEPEYVHGLTPSGNPRTTRHEVRMEPQTADRTVGHRGYASVTRNATTLGWSDCGHDDWRRGIVLDPFAGSGTTLEVATGHGRDAIGIDLDPRNLELARQRIGMFLVEA